MLPKIYLDLEDTIIEPIDNGWPQARFMDGKRLDRINLIIIEYKNHDIGIFSFAIANSFDRKAYFQFLNERLCDAVFAHVEDVPDHTDMLKACGTENTNGSTLGQLNALGKRLAFISYCKDRQEANHFILIDDTIENELCFVDGKIIQFIDATKL